MTDKINRARELYNSLADLIPAFKANAGQAEYDATLALLPELIAADPLHPLARVVLTVVQELEQRAGINARDVAEIDVPAHQ